MTEGDGPTNRLRQASSLFIKLGLFLSLEAIFFVWADRPIAKWSFELQSTSPAIFHFFQSITDIAKAQWYLWPSGVLTVVCGFLSRGKDVPQQFRRLFAYTTVRTFFIFSTLALSGIAADVLKPILGRARPILWIDKDVYGFHFFTTGSAWNSMPSGHTTTAVALALTLTTLYPRSRIIWILGACVLAASRIMVDAHYTSDVIAGAALGWLIVRLFVRYGIMRIWKFVFPIDRPFGPM